MARWRREHPSTVVASSVGVSWVTFEGGASPNRTEDVPTTATSDRRLQF